MIIFPVSVYESEAGGYNGSMNKQTHQPTYENVRKIVYLKDMAKDTTHTFELELEQHPTLAWVEHIALERYGLKRGQWAMTVRGLIDGEVVSNLKLIPYTRELADRHIAPYGPKDAS